MKTLKLKSWGETFKLNTFVSTYRNNDNLYVGLVDSEDGCPFADLTVNVRKLNDKDMAVIDTNNCPWAEEFIESNGLGSDTGMLEVSGFCVYPIYLLNIEKIKEYAV